MPDRMDGGQNPIESTTSGENAVGTWIAFGARRGGLAGAVLGIATAVTLYFLTPATVGAEGAWLAGFSGLITLVKEMLWYVVLFSLAGLLLGVLLGGIMGSLRRQT